MLFLVKWTASPIGGGHDAHQLQAFLGDQNAGVMENKAPCASLPSGDEPT